MKTTSFEFSSDGAVALIRLNRPDKLNALTFEVYRELTDTFVRLRDESTLRSVVVTGAGRGFCSGGGVDDIIAKLLATTPDKRYAFTRLTCDLVQNMRLLRKPVIAAVNGIAAGAGALIALASDIRVVSAQGKFAFLFVKVGLSGADMGAAWMLPRIVGFGRASEILMTGRTIEATEALAIGLANKVVPPEALMAEAMALAQQLALGPPFALAMTKEMLNREADMTLETALEAEAQAQSLCMESPEFAEGYRAFIDKRPPRFSPG